MTRNGAFLVTALLAGLTLCGAALTSAGLKQPAEGPAMQPALDNTDFALRLYRQLAREEGNVFFSPHSISTALAMTWAGARGATESEMARVLGFDLGQDELHSAFAALAANLERAREESGVQLRTANALWPQQGFEFARPFLDTVRANYDAELRPVDFARATEESRRIINSWVEQKTEDRIRELIKPGVLNSATRLVLTNAIYFKGRWQKTFDEKLTRDLPFTLTAGAKTALPLMWIKDQFQYGEAANLQLLRLAYGKGGLSMVILLPEETGGLPGLERNLERAALKDWLANLRRQEVELLLPRFRVDSQFQLNQALAALGMKEAFTPTADFSGMDPQRRLFLSAVIHQAFVEVNEEGTEAAAATGAVMQVTAMPMPPKVFRVDHPFIFMIMGPNDEILFMGRVEDPRRAGSPSSGSRLSPV
jgi:serpin B